MQTKIALGIIFKVLYVHFWILKSFNSPHPVGIIHVNSNNFTHCLYMDLNSNKAKHY